MMALLCVLMCTKKKKKKNVQMPPLCSCWSPKLSNNSFLINLCLLSQVHGCLSPAPRDKNPKLKLSPGYIVCYLLSAAQCGYRGSGGGVTGCHGGCVGEVTPTAEEGFALWSFLPTSPITACPLTRPPLKHFGRVKGPDFLAS